MIAPASTTSDTIPTMWDGRSLSKGKPNPVTLVSTVVTMNTAAQPSRRVLVARPPATTSPATMPTRLNTVWTRVNAAMLMPKIMGAPFRRKGPNVRGVVSACNAGVGVPYLAPISTPPLRAGGSHALDTLTDLRLARHCLRRRKRSTSRAVGRGRGGDQEDRAKLGSGDARR